MILRNSACLLALIVWGAGPLQAQLATQTIDVNGYGYGGVVPVSIFQKANFDANNISIELTS